MTLSAPQYIVCEPPSPVHRTKMPYFEPLPAELDAAEIINLKRIVELSSIPEVGPSPLDPKLTIEVRYTNALATLERSTAVFDEDYYQDAVFAEEMPESVVEQELLERARYLGVPESHLPENVMRNPPPCPAPHPVTDPSIVKSVPTSSPDRTLSLQTDTQRPGAASPPALRKAPSLSALYSHPPQRTLSLPGSNNFFRSMRSKVPPSVASSRPPTASTSAPSLSNSSSDASLNPNGRGKPKRRDSFMRLFRRDNKFKPRAAPLDETTAWSPSSPSDCDVPSLQSTRTHDQSSVQSTSLSSRTSTSSFADLSTLSWLETRALQKAMKTPRFLALQIRCQNEAKRFIDFSQHQRVALPLFLGRTRVYLERKMVMREAALKKQVWTLN
jgi:hypothetical protein